MATRSATAGGSVPPELCRELDRLQGALRASAERHAAEQDQLFDAFLARLSAPPAVEQLPAQAHVISLDDPGPSWASYSNGGGGAGRTATTTEEARTGPTAGHAPTTDAGDACGTATSAGIPPLPPLGTPDNKTEQGQDDHDRERRPTTISAQPSRLMTTTSLSPAAIALAGLVTPSQSSWSEKFQEMRGSSESTLARKLFGGFAAVARCFEEAEAPKGTSCVSVAARSSGFSILCGFVIFLNAIFIVYTTDFQMAQPGRTPTRAMQWIEVAFILFYIFELAFKFLAFRSYFFIGKNARFNIFDLVLVFCASIEMGTAFASQQGIIRESDTSWLDVSFLRCLRAFKLAKVMRIFKAVRFFRELQMMLNSVMGSFIMLFWSFVLLLFLLYVFSILIMQGLVMELYAREESPQDSDMIRYYFGSTLTAIITLLQSTTGGTDWAPIYEELSKHGPYLNVLFLFYVIFFVVATWNIVTSVFVDKALRMAQPDLETQAMEQTMQDINDVQELVALMKRNCLGEDGLVSKHQFQEITEQERFRSCLQVRGITINDASLFFDMLCSLADGDEPDIDTLVGALLRMKGTATSIDLHSLTFEMKILSRAHYQFVKECRANFKTMKKEIRNLLTAGD